MFFGDVARHIKAVNGTVLVLPAAISGVLVEIRIGGRAVRPGRNNLGIPECGGMEILEMIGQVLIHGRRDAVFLPEIIINVLGGDP
jgi:hypothetical protein